MIVKTLELPESDDLSDASFSPQHSTFDLIDSQTDCDEILSSYECIVEQEGYVYIKQERNEKDLANICPKWAKVYLTIQGTKVALDYGSSSKKSSSFLTKCLPKKSRALPVENTQLLPVNEFSEDHTYKIHTVLSNGKQILLRNDSASSAIQWSESLRSAINIAPDIENRKEIQFKMPKTIYCPH